MPSLMSFAEDFPSPTILELAKDLLACKDG